MFGDRLSEDSRCTAWNAFSPARLFIILCFLVTIQFTTGCSIINHNQGYKTYPPEGWTELATKNPEYRYGYKCNSFSISVRGAIFTKLSGYWGLPIVPIPVIPFSRKYDSLVFDLNIQNTAFTFPDGPLEIKMRIPSTGQMVEPVKSVTLTPEMIRKLYSFREWYSYDIDRWPLWPGYTFLYQFELIDKNVKEFEIIFPSETLGCSIPKLNFKAKSKIVYAPIRWPLPD